MILVLALLVGVAAGVLSAVPLALLALLIGSAREGEA